MNPRNTPVLSMVLASILCSSLVSVLITLLIVSLVHPRMVDAQSSQPDGAELLAVASAITEERQTCYASSACPNIDELTGLFAADARRTEIQRNNNVVLLEDAAAMRADNLRVAGSFPGRRLETTGALVQSRNVILLQNNWDPGASAPNPFISVFRIEGGQATHWVLISP